MEENNKDKSINVSYTVDQSNNNGGINNYVDDKNNSLSKFLEDVEKLVKIGQFSKEKMLMLDTEASKKFAELLRVPTTEITPEIREKARVFFETLVLKNKAK